MKKSNVYIYIVLLEIKQKNASKKITISIFYETVACNRSSHSFAVENTVNACVRFV